MFKITSEAILAKMPMPPELQGPFDRMIQLGESMLDSKEMHSSIAETLEGKGSIGERIGTGIGQLIMIMWVKSNKTLPPKIMAPATVYLIALAFDKIRRTGANLPDSEVAVAIEQALPLVMHLFGITPENADNIAQQFAQKVTA